MVKIMRFLVFTSFILTGLVAAYYIAPLVLGTEALVSFYLRYGFYGGVTAVFGLAGAFLTPWLARKIMDFLNWTVAKLHRVPTQDILGGAIGLILGLLIANLLSSAISGLKEIPGLKWVGVVLPLVGNLFFGYLGLILGMKRKEELLGLIPRRGREKEKGARGDAKGSEGIKILDTSVIIDGRIADIASCGFLEGVLVVPSFVLSELQHIADSSDAMRRNRGRRGLDILERLRRENSVSVQFMDVDYDDLTEVDSKLIRLAQELGGKIVTNDFNLNKVARLKGVAVLNVNELANAVKPVMLPGEEVTVQVIRDGKEAGQGIAYLEDGTMMVVDGGRKYINQQVPVVVTSVLQTSAGRMIFARLKNNDEGKNNGDLKERKNLFKRMNMFGAQS